jgi:hypothetical protein
VLIELRFLPVFPNVPGSNPEWRPVCFLQRNNPYNSKYHFLTPQSSPLLWFPPSLSWLASLVHQPYEPLLFHGWPDAVLSMVQAQAIGVTGLVLVSSSFRLLMSLNTVDAGILFARLVRTNYRGERSNDVNSTKSEALRHAHVVFLCAYNGQNSFRLSLSSLVPFMAAAGSSHVVVCCAHLRR